MRRLPLEPAGPSGSGRVVLGAHDPLTGVDHRGVVVRAGSDAVLVVDTVFAFRPEWEGLDEATPLHQDRYAAAEALHLAEVNPVSRADVVIGNGDWAAPRILRRGPT